jgi:hypothetical protein
MGRPKKTVEVEKPVVQEEPIKKGRKKKSDSLSNLSKDSEEVSIDVEKKEISKVSIQKIGGIAQNTIIFNVPEVIPLNRAVTEIQDLLKPLQKLCEGELKVYGKFSHGIDKFIVDHESYLRQSR